MRQNRNILSEILNGVWAMDRLSADAYWPFVASLLKGTAQPFAYDDDSYEDNAIERQKSRELRFATIKNGIYEISDYGMRNRPEDAPDNSIAIINICDVITKYDNMCGPAGMQTKSNLYKRADNNKNIKAIITVLDSGGGEGYAARMMNQVIKNLETPKVAFVDDMAASAAYYIASSHDDIIVNSNMARVGSIGTYVTIADYAKFWEKEGIQLLEVYADNSTEKNQDYYQAIEYIRTDGKKGSLDGIKKVVNMFNDQFLADVKENRGSRLTVEDKVWNTGKMFFGKDAEKAGLIDGIMTLDETVKSMFKYLN